MKDLTLPASYIDLRPQTYVLSLVTLVNMHVIVLL